MGCRAGPMLCLLFSMLLPACADTAYYAPRADAAAAARGGPARAAMDDVSDGLVSFAATQESGFDAGGWGDAAGLAVDSEQPTPADQAQDATVRKLIYSGSVTVEVPDPESSVAGLLAQVAEWGGHMQSQVGNRLTVRVPAGRFDAAFEQVKNAGRLIAEQRQAQDVTEEYRDLEIRLANATRSRDRLLALLDAAEKVEDILKIEKELRRLTDEIETMEGRRRYLADQVTLATLVADFRAVAEPPPDRRRRRASRFRWVNLIGAERVMEDF